VVATESPGGIGDPFTVRDRLGRNQLATARAGAPMDIGASNRVAVTVDHAHQQRLHQMVGSGTDLVVACHDRQVHRRPRGGSGAAARRQQAEPAKLAHLLMVPRSPAQADSSCSSTLSSRSAAGTVPWANVAEPPPRPPSGWITARSSLPASSPESAETPSITL